jgi:hypothetical protein
MGCLPCKHDAFLRQNAKGFRCTLAKDPAAIYAWPMLSAPLRPHVDLSNLGIHQAFITVWHAARTWQGQGTTG